MRVIGITGGIGSGKSFISRLLTDKFDIHVFNCDIEAHRITMHDPDIRKALTTLVGINVYNQDGTVNRPVLADYMFVQGHVNEVNAIIHPAVRRWFAGWKELHSHFGPPLPLESTHIPINNEPVVAIESAILIESGFSDLCSEIWLVTAPLELRINRAMSRDNATRDQIMARINAQTTDDERRKYASHIIVNDETGNLVSRINNILYP